MNTRLFISCCVECVLICIDHFISFNLPAMPPSLLTSKAPHFHHFESQFLRHSAELGVHGEQVLLITGILAER